MVKNSNTFYENEIHRVNSPFNEDSKNIIFLAMEALISGKGRPENFRENGPKTGKPIVMQIREWSILIDDTALYSLVSKYLHYFGFLQVRSNYLLKTEEVSFQAKFCPTFAALPYLKLGTFFKF